MRVRWSALALSDLASARGYIVEEAPSAAARIVERIEKAVEAVSRHPEIGRPGRLEGTRELVIPGTPFIIPYRVKNDRVELLAVIHASRRWPEAL